jgi:hypothetical protein
MDTTSEWHGEWLPLELARQLERELAQAKHRIRTLIEERDSARIQADHKWKLREEFEALLGTSDVEIGIERVKETQKGAARYEYVRKMHVAKFRKLNDLNFDAEVDRLRSET